MFSALIPVWMVGPVLPILYEVTENLSCPDHGNTIGVLGYDVVSSRSRVGNPVHILRESCGNAKVMQRITLCKILLM